jgi:hypothetical protein
VNGMTAWKLRRRDPSHEISWSRRLITTTDASNFINHANFCVLFPVKNVPPPSLYFAVSRSTRVTWGKHAALIWKWKDDLPKKRRAFYGKYFKARGTFLTLDTLTHLLAMHETAIAPDDAESFYHDGRISRDALELWQALVQHGPMPTLELRHACKMETQPGNKRFKKAMLQLQSLLIVTHSGAAQETESWASNRFDLVSRAFPKPFAKAQTISPESARKILAQKYRRLYPASSPVQIARLFGWTKAQAVAALAV